MNQKYNSFLQIGTSAGFLLLVVLGYALLLSGYGSLPNYRLVWIGLPWHLGLWGALSVGFLRRSRNTFMVCGLVGVGSFVYSIVMLTFMLTHWIVILSLSGGIFALMIFYSNAEMNQFQLTDKDRFIIKRLRIVLSTVLILGTGTYLSFIILMHLKMGTPRMLTCVEQNPAPTWRSYNLGFVSLSLPPHLERRQPTGNKGLYAIWISTQTTGLAVFLASNGFDHVYRDMKDPTLFGVNSFDFADHLVHAKFNVLLLILRALYGTDTTFNQFESGFWKGFVQARRTVKPGKVMQVYDLWHRSSGQTVELMIEGDPQEVGSTIYPILQTLK